MIRQTNTVAIIIVLLLTVAALGLLLYHSFGRSPVGARDPNPSSLQPVTLPADQGTFVAYSNRDVPQDYYSIEVPASWRANATVAGEYEFRSGDATATVKLTDVPDNSNLVLYVLSQVEPQLRTTMTGYQELNHTNMTVNGAEAFRLTYRSTARGAPLVTTLVFIVGSDQSGLISVSAPEAGYGSDESVFNHIIDSFSWRNP